MAGTESTIRAFFREYEARTNRALEEPPVVDVEATASAFAAYFVEASPAGVIGGENGDQLREAIPQGYEFYRSIGTQAMNIEHLDVTPLDQLHHVVKVHWSAHYDRPDIGQKTVEFDVFYLVQTREGELPTIFAYVTGDEQQVMKDEGLIPN